MSIWRVSWTITNASQGQSNFCRTRTSSSWTSALTSCCVGESRTVTFHARIQAAVLLLNGVVTQLDPGLWSAKRYVVPPSRVWSAEQQAVLHAIHLGTSRTPQRCAPPTGCCTSPAAPKLETRRWCSLLPSTLLKKVSGDARWACRTLGEHLPTVAARW